MIEKLATLYPEMAMLFGACVCMLMGLSENVAARRATVWVAAVTLLFAAFLATSTEASAGLLGVDPSFVKVAVASVGLLLLMVAAGVPDRLRSTADAEAEQEKSGHFEPGNVLRGEFYAFFLFSLTGVMLCAGANDLVWLFLALELTSLPTYVMVAVSRDKLQAQESAVKYFFLGAMAAAVFLYGFTFIYGATGLTTFTVYENGELVGGIAHYVAQEGVSPLLLAGLVISLIGLAFKIAAVPMHFYAADVYEGANVAVTAFLAFVPKTAGFLGIVLLLGLLPHDALPPTLRWTIWLMAAATMTVGNILALQQDNVKRLLAYSSIAHSGYVLVAVSAGAPGIAAASAATGAMNNPAGAVVFYLVAYGLATLASFAVLGCLHRNRDEAQTFDDLSGLVKRDPFLGGLMLISVLSLIGFPPFVGFIGKIYLFGTAYTLGDGDAMVVSLVVIAVINSAVSATYYLRIASACFFGENRDQTTSPDYPARRYGAAIAAFGALALFFVGWLLIDASHVAHGESAAAVNTNEVHEVSVLKSDTADQSRN